MNKQQVFDMYTSAIKLLHAEDMVFITDTNATIIYASNSFIASLKIDDISLIYLAQIYELTPIINNIHLKSIFENMYKNNSTTGQEFLISAPELFVNMSMFSLNHRALLNPVDNTVIGFVTFVLPINVEQKLSLLYQMLGVTDTIKLKQDTQIHLTKREQEILFLLCLKLSGREIAEIMTKKTKSPIGASTVGNIVRERIFPKFSVYNIEELINKAISLGYWNIPSNYCDYKCIAV